MRDGFIKVAAVTPEVRVADTDANAEEIARLAREAAEGGAKIIVFPELCITGYTCSDLFLQDLMLTKAKTALLQTAERTKELDALIFVGLPFEKDCKLYNVAAAINRGRILGLIPKTYIPNYAEFYEMRHFAPGRPGVEMVSVCGEEVPFGTNILFRTDAVEGLAVAAELCEDVWAPNPPSIRHALAGADVIVNCSASDETTGKAQYRRDLVAGQSARLICGYIYASAGIDESTQDLVYSGHDIIAENGVVLAESRRFKNETVYTELDIHKLRGERRRMSTFFGNSSEPYLEVQFDLNREETRLTRFVDPAPFVPDDEKDRDRRCEEIFSIQYSGLRKRLKHTRCRSAVVGISGGLDSTLALLVTVKAFDSLGIPRSGILGVTMPGFGTTGRTYTNACELVKRLGATLREISIKEAVNIHFSDIGHAADVHDVTYENSQARERTQILMDLANQSGGLVIGTGDMSELALGWATYNGDHMSMYAVNVGVPKTLVRHLVKYYADTCGDGALSDTLLDVLDTPVSPELLPPRDGDIAQKTEDLVGPYELHDFYLYHVLRLGFPPKKIFRLAIRAFEGKYDRETVLKWLKVFYRRYFAQQFKRSCLPDGPKVGSAAVSPRGDLRMPSDACVDIWQKELEEM